MKALVTVASRHGATTEIGTAVAESLQAAGIEVDVVPPDGVGSLAGYDAVIVGSGLYLGRWLGPARTFVEARADELRRVPVWLFASGPITPVKDEADIAEGEKLRALIGGRDNRLFAGRLEKRGLNVFERVSVSMVGSPWGDYRPWDEIRHWAEGIAVALREAAPAAVR